MIDSSLRALAYADIFDYPLTGKEIHQWAIGADYPSRNLPSKKFFTLPNREHLIALRHSKHLWSVQKTTLAKRVGKWLSYIPTIKLVAITGALAMQNSSKNDDIDLMIATSIDTLWLTRLIVVALTEIIGIRRRPQFTLSLSKGRRPSSQHLALSHQHSNKICLNLWLDETSLSVPKQQRNLYTAHEVAQITPIVNKNHTYEKFLSANSWINKYLPNIQVPSTRNFRPLNARRYSLVTIFEILAFKLQYLYMKPKMTRERVSPHFAFFHPRNTGAWVMREYAKRLKMLGIHP